MTYLLIDGKNLLFRAGFASRNLKTSDGRYSGAIHGFLKMLLRVRGQHPQAEIVILWETSGAKTYRHELYPGYKDRSGKGSPDASTSGIHQQIASVQAVCAAIGLRWVSLPLIEADDLAGLLAVYLTDAGQKVLLLSGDKDWWQLASMRTVCVLCEQGSGDRHVPVTDLRVADAFKMDGLRAKDLLRYRPFIGDTSVKIPSVRPRFRQSDAYRLLRAGADPRWPLHAQPDGVRQHKDIKEIWPVYQRNYRLMRIARQAADCELTGEQYSSVIRAVLGDSPAKNYREMLRVLAEWELADAISNRAAIFALADRQTPGVESEVG